VQNHLDQVSIFKSEPDRGIYDALNKGINTATGDVVGFLHADDLYSSSETLATIAKRFEDPTVCAVYGDLEYVSQNDTSRVVRRWKSKPFIAGALSLGWMPPHPTLYVRRERYSKIGGFDTSYRIAADYLSILQLFGDKTFKAIYIPQVLVRMRLGGVSNRSLKTILRKSREDWRALLECGFGLADTAKALTWKNLSKLSQFVSARSVPPSNS
jgi:glycosyltransferase